MKLILLLAALVAATSGQRKFYDCPAGYSEVGDNCAKFFNELASHDDAIEKCGDVGAELLQPKSEQENSAYYAIAAPSLLANPIGHPKRNMHLAMKRKDKDSYFHYHNRKIPYYLYAKSDQLNDAKRLCGVVSASYDGKWILQPCSGYKHPYLCIRHKVPMNFYKHKDISIVGHDAGGQILSGMGVGQCYDACKALDGCKSFDYELATQTCFLKLVQDADLYKKKIGVDHYSIGPFLCPNPWLLDPESGRCYQRFHNRATKFEADRSCNDIRGELPAAKNQEENDFIYRVAPGHDVGNRVWLPLTDIGTEGHFKWDDGEWLGAFNKWRKSSKEPNNANRRGEDCVTIENDGSWNDVNCEDSGDGYYDHALWAPYPNHEVHNNLNFAFICVLGDKRPPNAVIQIVVEVADAKNAQSVDAECSIAFANGNYHEFTAPGGSPFARGQKMSFRAPLGMGTGNLAHVNGLKLKCKSVQKDALQVVKLYVRDSNNKNYVGKVNVVFDDQESCNVRDVDGINDCKLEKSVVMALE